MKLINESYNKLIERKDVILEVDHDKAKTPSYNEIIEKLLGYFKVDKELIKINHIYTNYGSTKSKIIVSVYDDIKNLKAIEEIKKKAKKGNKENAKEKGKE